MVQKKLFQKDYRINDEIDYNNGEKVRIVDGKNQTFVVSFEEAKKIASENEMDLIEINVVTTPHILRLDNYDKFMYQIKKNAKKNKQTPKPLKEIDLRVNIAKNDIETKARKAKEFIEDGSKVKVVLTFKGREMSRREENKKSIYEFISILENVAVAEGNIKDEGNKTIVVLKKK